MEQNQGLLKIYNEDEVEKLLSNKTKLVYVDTGGEEIVARYEDLPDVIVDINDKLGQTDLKVYDFEEPDMYNPLLTTSGEFLNKCDPQIWKDIIDRLAALQTGEEEVKDYKVIDEDMLDDVINNLEQESLER